MPWVKEGDFRGRLAACTYKDVNASCTTGIDLRWYIDQCGEIETYRIKTSFSSEAQAAAFKKKLELICSPDEIRYDFFSDKTVELTVETNCRQPRHLSTFLFPRYLKVLFEDSNVKKIAADLCTDLNADKEAFDLTHSIAPLIQTCQAGLPVLTTSKVSTSPIIESSSFDATPSIAKEKIINLKELLDGLKYEPSFFSGSEKKLEKSSEPTPLLEQNLGKAFSVLLGTPCEVNSMMDDWHMISFSSEKSYQQIQEYANILSSLNLSPEATRPITLSTGLEVSPARLKCNDSSNKILKTLEETASKTLSEKKSVVMVSVFKPNDAISDSNTVSAFANSQGIEAMD